MKVAALFSGGKDSTMAVYKAIEEGNHVKYLVSMISDNPHSYMYHVPNIHLTSLLSKALEIPLIKGITRGEKEKELEDLKLVLEKLTSEGIEGIYSGALSSIYQKSRIDKICDELGLRSYSPLWHIDPEKYLKELIELGFEVIITGVAAEGFDKSWLGRKIDIKVIDELIQLNKRYGIHIAFEGGEAETLVLNCPIFKKRINIVEAEKIWERDSGYLHIKKAVLNNK